MRGTSFEKHLNISQPGMNGVSVLAEACPEISRQKLKQAMQFGAVWLTRKQKTSRLRRAKAPLNIGDELHLYYDEAILFGQSLQAQLVADEKDYSLWNKPCGMLSQGGKWGDHTAICRWVELQGLALNGLPQRQTFLVHRLDRATSGLILVAHSKKVAAKLASLFEQRQIEKCYKASTKGKFPWDGQPQRIEAAIDDKNASTLVLDAQYDPKLKQSHLLLKIETGRKHQIRKHLSAMGYPIVGDRLYGDYSDKEIQSGELPDLQLQSCSLSFVCPLSGEARRYSLD